MMNPQIQQYIPALNEFLKENLEDKVVSLETFCMGAQATVEEDYEPLMEYSNVSEFIDQHEQSFQDVLFKLFDQKGMDDVKVYQKAEIDRKYFSKIRNGAIPRKKTIFALCLALELTEEEADALLESAGYAFSRASTTDLIVLFCIQNHIYDLWTVNALLDEYGEPTLR